MSPVAPAPVRRQIGTTGIGVFPYGIDGSVFGWTAGFEAAIDVLDEFHGAGGTLISTADHYAGGRSEVMIGAWLARQPARERLVLATKIGRHPDTPGLSARNIRAAVDNSLERLRTGYLDLLSFDGDHPETPLEESLTAVADLMASGKVRHLAVSDFSGARLIEARAVAGSLGLPFPEAVFAEYNLMERRRYESEIAPISHAQQLGVLAKLPLASGYLRGDFRSRDDLPSSPMFAAALRYVGRRGNKVLDTLETISHEVGENIGRVAIAWVLSKPGVAAAVVRAKDGPALLDLMPAAELQLTRHQLALLDRVTA
ncbi:aldo/keto reductase [Naasia aerilata]|uniref:Oxidoreductase n=1 Tax=Naasia aerilata TaxID=1162966 RepID=A0ABM8GGY3_9MICO|nr:aldo/keto reductase [Naasia aerilata]BDZ47614.1 oxidoreductase [Naasia aerilata]